MIKHEQGWSPYARIYDPLKAGSIDGTDTEPHDHAIIRALEAHYKPNRLVVGNPRCTLFVARLNPETSEEKLKSSFSRYGEIVRCRLVLDIVTGFSKCYGFVEFKDRFNAIEAHRDAHKSVIDDHEILVDFECERTMKGWIPRRLGGGFSGKKESGQLRFGGRDRPFRKPIVLANPYQKKVKDEQPITEQALDERKVYERERFKDSYDNRISQRPERESHSDNPRSERNFRNSDYDDSRGYRRKYSEREEKSRDHHHSKRHKNI